MKIAIIQNNPVTGDIDGNARGIIKAVREAASMGADLCIAPELALCGHNAADMFLNKDFIADVREKLNEMAAELDGAEKLPPLLLGAPIVNPVPQGKPLHNSAIFLSEGKVSVVSRKVLLPFNGSEAEHHYFEPGVACGVLQYKGWRFAVTVGEDIWNDRTFWQDKRPYDHDPVSVLMNSTGADAIINITAQPYAQSLIDTHQKMICWSAGHYRSPIIVASLVGGNDELVYFGSSFACDGEGRLTARAPAFEEAILLVDMDNAEKNSISPDMEAEEELWKAVVMGTGDFIRKCGFTDVVIGLSGGVDSSLVAAVAAEAVGPEHVTGLLMPSEYSSRGSLDDSLELAGNLGIKTHVLPITPVLSTYEAAYSVEFPKKFAGAAEENTQARIRGNLLMAYSNSFGAMVLNTSNKSEDAVGYSTLYGDAIGGLAPIGDLYKWQVYSLCYWINSRGKELVPGAVLTKEPSAELKPGQKDSDSLPPYDVLDPILFGIIENGMGSNELVESGFSRELVGDVLALIRRAEFKRHQAPPALKLTSRGFSKEWRKPIAIGGKY